MSWPEPLRSVLALLPLVVLGAPVAPAGPREAATPAPTTRYVLPLTGPPRVVDGFRPPTQRWLAGHRGVDLAGRAGAAVRAAGPGIVGVARMVAGIPVVTVLHGALRTTYQPVLPTVRSGQRVAAGEVIGRLTVVGGHCRPGTCLHWGLLRGRTYLDPMSLLDRGPPVLLPLTGGLVRPAAVVCC